MDLGSIAPAVLGLIFQVNGLDLNAAYLRGDQPGCAMAAQRANAWRREGLIPIEQRVGDWCVVGTVSRGFWVAEQWMAHETSRHSRGWRVQIPLHQDQQRSVAVNSDWPLEMTDRQLKTRIKVRHSLRPLAAHHEASLRTALKAESVGAIGTRVFSSGLLSVLPQGLILFSGYEPRLGSYSISIER